MKFLIALTLLLSMRAEAYLSPIFYNANQLQGVGVSATSPTDGQCLVYDMVSGTWNPNTCGGGGGGSGTVTSIGISVPGTSIFSVTGSPVTTSGTIALATTGTSGGIPYFSSTSQLASSAALTVNRLVLGGGAGAAPTVAAAITAARALISDGSGIPTQSATTSTELGYVNGVTSAIQTQLNAKGVGSVTSVGLSTPASSLFSVTGSPVTGSGTLAIATAGTSGGIPYFDTTSTLNSSAALTANRIVLGGGAGAAPTVVGSLGTTTTLLHGNAAGAPTFGAVGLTTDVSGTLPVGNGGTGTASTFTQGSVLFADGSGIYSQDNANLFWDSTNHSLGIGNAAPGATYKLNVTGPEQITSSSATSFVVGQNGATNPAFLVDSSAATSVNGASITSSASGAGVIFGVISSATSEPLTIQSKAGGLLTLKSPGTAGLLVSVNSATKSTITNSTVTFTPGVSTSASAVRFSYTGPGDTTLTASTEAPNWYINLSQTRQHATGTLALQRDVRISPTTHSFVGASGLTDAATLSIDGPPNGGTNATITNSHGIYIPTSTLANTTNGYGLTVFNTSGATNNFPAQFLTSAGASLLTITNANGTNIKGTTTNDAAAAGFVGELLEGTQTSNTNFPATATWGDLTSVSLTAGDWVVTAEYDANANSATVPEMLCGISSTTGNSATGLTEGTTRFNAPGPTAAANNHCVVASMRVSVASTTTYYLKFQATYTVATPRAVGRISAWRVR